MLVKLTRQRGSRTEVIVATPVEPLDTFQNRLDEAVECFRRDAATPQRFLDLENARRAGR